MSGKEADRPRWWELDTELNSPMYACCDGPGGRVYQGSAPSLDEARAARDREWERLEREERKTQS